MAKQNRFSFFKNNKKIKDNIDLLQQSLDGLYQDTYYNQKTNLSDSENIRDDIEKSIDNIMMNNYSNTSIGNMTKIYSQLQLDKSEKDNDLLNAMNIFEDPLLMNNILATYNQNKWIRDLDFEIDTILKYMPKLKEALNCKRDSVLSADHFSKDFVNFHNVLSQDKQELFNKRMEEIKRVYKLPTNFEDWYDNAQTYGECYVYIVPYSQAFRQLLKNKNNGIYQATEMAIISEGALDTSSSFNNIQDAIFKEALTDTDLKNELSNLGSLNVTLNKSGVLLSSADSLSKAENVIKQNKFKSLNEIFQESYYEEIKNINESSKTKISDQLIPNDLEMPKELEDDRMAQDGIFTGKRNIRSESDPKIKVPGCIVKKLDRANVIPIYIEDICLGYYYLEFKANELSYDDPNYLEFTTGINTIGNAGLLNRTIDKQQTNDNKNKIINYISKQLSDVIDSNFINANQDLRKELYMILKHNEIFNSINGKMAGNINISFLPSEDVIHIAFEKDPVTHRGISDLQMSLFPAKLYACLYITHVLGTLTRGQDKRVYYVKQNVETNISKTLLNVLNQIKKGNFGARQMENLGSILNITGRFNDYIIPMSQSGEAPIQFEVMEGQRFEFQSELMDKLEEMAINATDVPIELINARQSLDYAIQATMSNSKFMRNVFKRQDTSQDYFSDIATKIYNYEYMEMETIEMTLPAPAFINMTNGSQLIQGTVQYMETLSNIEMADESDDVKAEFNKIGVNYYLSSHINMSLVTKFKQQAKINASIKKTSSDNNEE